jgi:DNA-binding MarR family transcriptional regulator
MGRSIRRTSTAIRAAKNVNMTDIIPRTGRADPTSRATPQDGRLEIVELLFFAYRDFVSDPDAILAEYGFGRAHHRVLHFVDRNPGLTVADLLDILKITKQSLARVLKQLVDSGHVEQRPGRQDRRQRLLFTTDKGRLLAARLCEPQSHRIRTALQRLEPDARQTIADFLFAMIDEPERPTAARLVRREPQE